MIDLFDAVTTSMVSDAADAAKRADYGFTLFPTGRPLLEAIDYLRLVQSGRKRPGPPPIAFAPKIWLPQLKSPDGAVDLTGYKLCVLDELRKGLILLNSLEACWAGLGSRQGLFLSPFHKFPSSTVCVARPAI